MKINEAIGWLSERGVRTGPYCLDRINFLLEELEKPHLEYASVLIGGTNGKGSVTAITESVLSHCDEYITGSFTSPHLNDLRERIKIGRRNISDKTLISAVSKLQEVYRLMEKEASIGIPSFFECITATAFYAFQEEELDLAIVEVGLGGRFDSTNACNPEISVITNIGTDHQEFLGYGKLSIAKEKLGIIRKKRPLITGEKDPEILKEFEKACSKIHSPLIIARPENHFDLIESREDGHLVRIKNMAAEIFLPLPGNHQLDNLAIALELINQLRANGFEISDDAVLKGIGEVRWPGRLQWLDGSPRVLLDGAHNAEGMASLISYLKAFPPAEPLNIIFGSLKDKPVDEMAGDLSQFGQRHCFVPPPCGRALSQEDFDLQLKNKGWEWFEDFKAAYEECKKNAGTVIVTGSLYLISEALKCLKK